jgi:saccharopine dehydrogenase-like NADP-dependent oxidoreductase
MHRIIVLGSGMVGSTMAIDLAGRHLVTVADRNEDALNRAKQKCNELTVMQLDVTDTALLDEAIKSFDLVLCAVPGFLGFQTLKSVIEAGKDVVDISFFPENVFELQELATKKNVTAIVDCGVAPGMGNMILGYHNEKMRVTDFECLVGGLPKVKNWPFCYKAPFSPVDVIEEYTRPARYVEHGKMVVREALSDCEFVLFDKVGTLESFNSDGLRSLITTMPHIPNMKEKTLRYPGHVEYIRVLKESGFFRVDKMKLHDAEITPLEFTSKILFDAWKLGENEEEFTVMRITVTGITKEGKTEVIVYELYDEYDLATKTSSMARTTGYTATAAVNMILDGIFTKKGVFPPELIGDQETCFNYVLNYLRERGVVYAVRIN